MKKIKGFSLAEVLIVLAIIGILIMLVIPNQTSVATRTKSMEAQQELKMIHNLEYSYFLQYSKYSPDFKEISYEEQKHIDQGGNALYKLELIEASQNSFLARATALQDFNGDGQYNIWEINHEGIPKEIQTD